MLSRAQGARTPGRDLHLRGHEECACQVSAALDSKWLFPEHLSPDIALWELSNRPTADLPRKPIPTDSAASRTFARGVFRNTRISEPFCSSRVDLRCHKIPLQLRPDS